MGGLDAYLNDIKIPDKYGINQNVGDTIGPGGVFRALRTVPVMVDICKDMEKLCPNTYPILRKVAQDKNLWDRVIGGYKKFGMKDMVRFEIMKHFGYFVTESPYHMSEYVPYFRKTKKQMGELGVSYRWMRC